MLVIITNINNGKSLTYNRVTNLEVIRARLIVEHQNGVSAFDGVYVFNIVDSNTLQISWTPDKYPFDNE